MSRSSSRTSTLGQAPRKTAAILRSRQDADDQGCQRPYSRDGDLQGALLYFPGLFQTCSSRGASHFPLGGSPPSRGAMDLLGNVVKEQGRLAMSFYRLSRTSAVAATPVLNSCFLAWAVGLKVGTVGLHVSTLILKNICTSLALT